MIELLNWILLLFFWVSSFFFIKYYARYVANFIRKIERGASLPQGQNYTNLYIKNLEPEFTDDLLGAKFSEFGKVLSAAVMKDGLGKSRGFGFVTFELMEQAMEAMEALNGSVLGKNVSDFCLIFP